MSSVDPNEAFLDVDTAQGRVVWFEKIFYRTSMALQLLFLLFSLYFTFDFSYSLYYITKTHCPLLILLFLLNILSDILFWTATAILYLAIKYAQVTRLRHFNYALYALILIRFLYAINLLLMDESLKEDQTGCKLTSQEKIKKILLYLLENLSYALSVGTVHYLISLLSRPPQSKEQEIQLSRIIDYTDSAV